MARLGLTAGTVSLAPCTGGNVQLIITKGHCGNNVGLSYLNSGYFMCELFYLFLDCLNVYV